MERGGGASSPHRPRRGALPARLVLIVLAACESTPIDPITTPDGGAISPLVCQPPESICESQCIDTMTSDLHCGGCNLPCTGGTVCEQGSCVCPPGLELCNGACVDLMTDSGNCMGCGNTCLDGRVCEGGLCICPPSFMECTGQCVDLETDEANCGACDAPCSPLQTCENRACGCGDLSACSGDSTGYCSRNLERFCCASGEEFCDVNDAITFPGGCIPSGLDCGNIFACGGNFVSCAADRAPYCSSTGAPSCCAADRPVFCDSIAGIGYDGGCWDPNVDCGTLTPCGNIIFACFVGGAPHCSTTNDYFCCGANEVFCDARPGIGYNGGCWPSNIACGSITDCGGGDFRACPQGTGNPNCTTNVCE